MTIKAMPKVVLSVMFTGLILGACSSTPEQDSGGDYNAGSTGQNGNVDVYVPSVDASQSASSASSSGSSSSGSYSSGGSSANASKNDAASDMSTTLYFDFDKSELRADVRAGLDVHARRLRGQTGTVRLEGHADERGTREYNVALGERRAKAVANYLVSQGISSSQIDMISYGEEKPVALGNNDRSWAKNRRVELIHRN